MKYQLLYNGEMVYWQGHDYAIIHHQDADTHPTLPEGYYRLLLNRQNTTYANGKQPEHFQARVEPADIETKARCSPVAKHYFYLSDIRDDTNPYCLQVDIALFRELELHLLKTGMQRVTLKVEYA